MIQAAMNGSVDWAAVMGTCSVIASLATLSVVAYNGGRLTQKVDDHEVKFAEQGKTNVYFHEKVAEHDREFSRLSGIDIATRNRL